MSGTAKHARKRSLKGQPFNFPLRPTVLDKPGEVFEAALRGDKLAAQEALEACCAWVAHSCNDSAPLPRHIADYLYHALRRMTFGDKQADGSRKKVTGDEAFNLKRSGQQRWTLKDKRLVVSVVAEILTREFIDENTNEKYTKTVVGAIEYAIMKEIPKISESEKYKVKKAKEELLKIDEKTFENEYEKINYYKNILNESRSIWSNFFDRVPHEKDITTWWGEANK